MKLVEIAEEIKKHINKYKSLDNFAAEQVLLQAEMRVREVSALHEKGQDDGTVLELTEEQIKELKK